MMIFRVNGCVVASHAFELRRDGETVPVQPQVLDLLILLLENRHRLVTKDGIVERIWHGRIVSDATLNSRIKSARQAIGDSGASQQLIRTIRRRGFRFVGEVSQILGEVAGDGTAMHASATQGSTPRSPPSSNTSTGHPPARMRSLALEGRASWWTWAVVAAWLVHSLQACSAS
jgi:DNA-binding winged helix-turn-helix (wHTH) protein